MNYLKGIIFIFISAFILSGCIEKDDTVYESVDAMIEAAKAEVKTMGMEELKALLDNHTEVQVIDCREDYDFMFGHISGAVHIPRGLLEFSGKLSNRRIPTLVFGNEMGSAALAVQSLKKLKYKECYMLDFSWFDWEATYPDLVQQGMGESAPAEPVKQESSGGGCGD